MLQEAIITGDQIIAGQAVPGAPSRLQGFSPSTGELLPESFSVATEPQVDAACRAAADCLDTYRALPDARRADFLEAAARHVEALGTLLIERASAETGLPVVRLTGELSRTTGQLRMFAQVVREGLWHGAIIDKRLPERRPLPRPDLRQAKVAVGPVVVFGASNFPLAFSVAGGDTASALAAGCPVVVKAHPAHPGTSELVGRAMAAAALEAGVPAGVFSLLQGFDHALSTQLVKHPAIAAVGFTGSRQGGLALWKQAQERTVPIPVYAEMSAVNPVFMLPARLETQAEDLARQFVESLTAGAGQFCTNPGLVVGLEGAAWRRFVTTASQALSGKVPGVMLTPGIRDNYLHGVDRLASAPSVSRLGSGQAATGSCDAAAALFETHAADFLNQPVLGDEVFGASSLLVTCQEEAELMRFTEHLEGQLTATLHLSPADHDLARRLLPILERKAGRILVNGFPTGVEVSYAMVHGGPFPATSDSRTTSVGMKAIERFLRPVCYQDLPDDLLPPALQAANPLGIWREENGQPVQP